MDIRFKRERVAELGKDTSLRQELGMLRLLLEETWNGCGSDEDLAAAMKAIVDLITKISKHVTDVQKLEEATPDGLSKAEATKFASSLVDAVAAVAPKYTDDPQGLLGEVAAKIRATPISTAALS